MRIKTAYMLIPVGTKQRDDPGEYIECPREKKVFGESRLITKKGRNKHTQSTLECQCFIVLSNTLDARLIIEFEKSVNLQMCRAAVHYERDRDVESIEKILKPISVYGAEYKKAGEGK
ncbi:MAG: hypothetical protein IB618_00875 [Candidatus Pacearchaeota archaeon]|nr:MAG: hypothetical protein IB618_00875 [Candidatus Pacearchaeota archaeon]